MKASLGIFLAVALLGCVTPKAGARDMSFGTRFDAASASIDQLRTAAENCQYIESRNNLAGAIGAGASVLAGASGIGVAAIQDESSAKWGVIIGGIVLGATAAVTTIYSTRLAEAYKERGCADVHQAWFDATKKLAAAATKALDAPEGPVESKP